MREAMRERGRVFVWFVGGSPVCGVSTPRQFWAYIIASVWWRRVPQTVLKVCDPYSICSTSSPILYFPLSPAQRVPEVRQLSYLWCKRTIGQCCARFGTLRHG